MQNKSSRTEYELNEFGALPSQQLEQCIADGQIAMDETLSERQIQPASIDLRLGSTAYRVRSSFLPGAAQTVEQCLASMATHQIDIANGAVLEKGCVYLVPLIERLALPKTIAGAANPKSSTGRLDVFTRLITDFGEEFEQIPAGYHGPLYAEITPLTFSILVRRGSTLSQLRLRRGNASLNDDEHFALHSREPLVDSDVDRSRVRGGIPLSVDLSDEVSNGVIGYRAKRHSGVIDVDKPATYHSRDFWETIRYQAGKLILDPGEFYILVSRENVCIPHDYAAEMVPYDNLVGEFRVHYAGFFDPGFGANPSAGARAVLEVRSFDVPFQLEHGQAIGRLVYEPMIARPQLSYGGGSLSSNYQSQGLKLSKHFIADDDDH